MIVKYPMQTSEARVFFTPAAEELRFLPEGPYPYGDQQVSWVAIQHGADATSGSLNLLELSTGHNRQIPLTGRPGFAFPTTRSQTFIVGLERSLVLLNVETGESTTWVDGVDAAVEGTIINDGVTFDGHLVFGCKELKFSAPKAGLYLLRRGERSLVKLSGHEICSNGKAVTRIDETTYRLLDIDTPTKQVVGYTIDVAKGELRDRAVVLDLTAGAVFPDGMIMTPDRQSIIIAFYDPREQPVGEARQYALASGELEAVWTCPGSPRVTCPQLIRRQGRIELLLTTADEGMSPSLRALCPYAGCMFVGETRFDSLGDAPSFMI